MVKRAAKRGRRGVSMSDETKALADAPQRAAAGRITAIVMPALLAAFSFWATTHSHGAIVWLLLASGAILIAAAGIIAIRGQTITNPQDYYGGLALIGLALFAFWAA